jgi:hypothetical protein
MSFQYTPLTGEPPSSKHTFTNRRGYVRYQCGPATPGRVQVVDGEEWQCVWVLDLSLGGAGLLLSRPLDPGVALVLRLRSDRRHKNYDLPARVAHASRQPDGDWIIGCEFDQRLTDELLDALL